MPYLVIVRHGQSQWNLENRFTGDVDVELTKLGEDEALLAGSKLKNLHFDLCFTSVLKRAKGTLNIILKEIGKTNLPIVCDAALNERRYGSLQGLNKAETAAKFSEAQVMLWRRSYDVAPPDGESLKDTYNRVVPFYKTAIEPKLREGKDILISAHGNSLRALMMYLENIDPVTIANVNIATGIPRLYNFDNNLHLTEVKNL